MQAILPYLLCFPYLRENGGGRGDNQDGNILPIPLKHGKHGDRRSVVSILERIYYQRSLQQPAEYLRRKNGAAYENRTHA